MADIQYLNYGDQQIEQQALLNSLANNVQQYVQNQSWSKKRKDKFMSAYSDLMNRGLLGASNTSGQWVIDVNGDPLPFDSMDQKDREMYQEAAYFIQQQMAGLPTKASQEEKAEEEDKSKLPIFEFNNSFKEHVNKSINGGNPLTIGGTGDQWNYLDERDPKTGLRGRTERAKKLAELLESYKTKVVGDGSKFNFEGSSYDDVNDFNTKIDTAIAALRTPEIEDDRGALQAIGLNQADWFNNGSGDPSGTVITLSDGTQRELNYDELAKYNQQKAQFEAQKKKQQIIQQQNNRFNTATRSSVKMVGQNPQELAKKYQNDQGLLNQLSTYAQSESITPEQWSEIVGAYKYYNSKGALQNLSKEELDAFSGLRSYNGLGPGVLKKLPGVNGFYFDTRTGQVIKPGRNDQQTSQPIQGLLEQNNPEYLAQQAQKAQNSKKMSDEDWDILGADTVSMLGDIVSLGGGYAGAAGGITTLISDLYSDIRRGKDIWDTAKNLAKNTAWGFAGLIPGVKLAKLGKKAAQLYALYNSYGIITDPDVHKSWQKLINGEDFTSHDFENLKWTLHAVTGAHNTVRSHYTDKALQNKTQKTVVETKNGQKSITQSQVKEINKAGGRGGQKKASEKFKEITGEEAKEGQFQFSPEGRKWYNPIRYSQKLRNLTSDEKPLQSQTKYNRIATGRLLVQDRNKPLIANPFSASTYKNWFTGGGPNRGYYTMALSRQYNNTKPADINQSKLVSSASGEESPYAKKPLEQKKVEAKNTEFFSEEKKPNYNRETIKQYKEIMNNKFSNNKLKSGDYTIGGEKVQVVKQTDGTFNIIHKGNIIGNYRSQIEIQKQIKNLIKEGTKGPSQNTKPKISAKEMGQILRDLKAKGWLKHGGKITDNDIDNFLKQYKL